MTDLNKVDAMYSEMQNLQRVVDDYLVYLQNETEKNPDNQVIHDSFIGMLDVASKFSKLQGAYFQCHGDSLDARMRDNYISASVSRSASYDEAIAQAMNAFDSAKMGM